MIATGTHAMEEESIHEPPSPRFFRRPSLARRSRPRSLQIRQSTSRPPADVDSDSDSDMDSPSPTTSTFPARPTGNSGSASGALPAGASASGAISSKPVNQEDLSSLPAQDPTTGIALGVVGAASIVLCIGVGIWWLCRRSRKKKRASRQTAVSVPNPQADPRQMQYANMPPDRQGPRRSPSSLMGELMTAAYDVEQGGQQDHTYSQTPHGYLDVKRYDPNQTLPILQPAPVAQPVVSESIAGWVRRHNPLKLNPVNGRASIYSTAGTITPRDLNAPQPAVPAMPDAYQTRSLSVDDDEEHLVPPPLAFPNRVASSHYSDRSQSPVPTYSRNSGSWFHRGAPAAAAPEYEQEKQEQQSFNPRAPSMAMTERTESTWATWGGGVSRPQYQPEMPPDSQRKAWIEKCVRLGGLR